MFQLPRSDAFISKFPVQGTIVTEYKGLYNTLQSLLGDCEDGLESCGVPAGSPAKCAKFFHDLVLEAYLTTKNMIDNKRQELSSLQKDLGEHLRENYNNFSEYELLERSLIKRFSFPSAKLGTVPRA